MARRGDDRQVRGTVPAGFEEAEATSVGTRRLVQVERLPVAPLLVAHLHACLTLEQCPPQRTRGIACDPRIDMQFDQSSDGSPT